MPSRSIPVRLERERAAQAGPYGLDPLRDGHCAKPAGTPPLLRLERFQNRGASQCRSPRRPPFSSGSSSSPPAPAPAASSKRQEGAPPPPCPPPRLALSRLTFRSPDPRRGAPLAAAGPTADLGRRARLCPLSHPKHQERSRENRTMSRAGNRGNTQARWLGTGLLGKIAPALSFFSLAPFLTPPHPEGGEERCLRQGGTK